MSMIPMCSSSRSPRPFTAGIPPILRGEARSAQHGPTRPAGPPSRGQLGSHWAQAGQTQHASLPACTRQAPRARQPSALITPHRPSPVSDAPQHPKALQLKVEPRRLSSLHTGRSGSPGTHGAPRRPYKSRDGLRGGLTGPLLPLPVHGHSCGPPSSGPPPRLGRSPPHSASLMEEEGHPELPSLLLVRGLPVRSWPA